MGRAQICREALSSLCVIATMFCAAITSGCAKTEAENNTQPAALGELSALKTKIGELEQKVFALELYRERYESAALDPTGSRSYQRVDGNVGYFLVVLENAEPYLDGQKITLLIGNPNNVTFSGVKLKAKWGPRYPEKKQSSQEWLEAYQAYTASSQEKEIELTDTLRAGTWNKVQFTIAPAKTDAFGRLEIGINTNQVRLSGAS
jgi:hypothetical protein